MRMLTKAEACRELAVSLSTLDRRIASGKVRTKREPRGRRHRVYVMLGDDLPRTVRPPSRSWPWPRSGHAGWNSRCPSSRSSLSMSASATPSWSTS